VLYNINYILDDILYHINNKEPFSLVRLGDGDLKLLVGLLEKEINKPKFDRSGIPYDKGKWLLQVYKRSCNSANYISSFEMYGTKKFWSRNFSGGTSKKINGWLKIYERVGIENENFCNPEIGHLLFLNDVNFLEKISHKKICLITCFPKLKTIMNKRKIDAKIIIIPPLNSNHYSKYKDIIKIIKKESKETDVFLVGAGALGKGYLNYIKRIGGVGIDIGQVMNVWSGKRIPGRFNNILQINRKTLLFKLNKKVENFRKYL